MQLSVQHMEHRSPVLASPDWARSSLSSSCGCDPPRCKAAERALTTFVSLQSLIPVVMSGIIAVYGLVVSVLIAGGRKFQPRVSPFGMLSLRSATRRILPLRRIRPSRSGACVWPHRSCCGIRNRLRGRFGMCQYSVARAILIAFAVRTSVRIRVEGVRIYGSHSDLWRGAGTLRVRDLRCAIDPMCTDSLMTVSLSLSL